MQKRNLNLLSLQGVSILEQLQIEEALLRADRGNWCILNHGAPPAIVMGISGKPEKLLNLPLIKRDGIPIIKRFSGGGTVVIDENTLFVTFIFNGSAFPNEILKWSENLYRPLFPEFALKENDYVFGEKKFGGNAQYIQKGRWLHHTSFLWDFDHKKMEYLLLPERTPEYRKKRPHGEFLCRLKERYSVKTFFENLKKYLNQEFIVEERPREKTISVLGLPHRKATETLILQD